MLSDQSIKFLLTEFQESVSQWQHNSESMDKEVQYYFTLVGLIGVALGVVAQLGMSAIVIVTVLHFLALIVAVAGYRLLRRITHLAGQSALFSAQIGLIRRCFLDLDEQLEPYVILTTASMEETAHHFTPVSGQPSVMFLIAANCLLTIIVIVLTPVYFYMYFPSSLPSAAWRVIFTIFGTSAVVASALLLRHQRARIVLMGDRYLERITQIVQNNLRERVSDLVE